MARKKLSQRSIYLFSSISQSGTAHLRFISIQLNRYAKITAEPPSPPLCLSFSLCSLYNQFCSIVTPAQYVPERTYSMNVHANVFSYSSSRLLSSGVLHPVSDSFRQACQASHPDACGKCKNHFETHLTHCHRSHSSRGTVNRPLCALEGLTWVLSVANNLSPL